jgi:hypothetical protein
MTALHESEEDAFEADILSSMGGAPQQRLGAGGVLPLSSVRVVAFLNHRLLSLSARSRKSRCRRRSNSRYTSGVASSVTQVADHWPAKALSIWNSADLRDVFGDSFLLDAYVFFPFG